MGFISHHEIERGLIRDRMRAVIVGEFCMGDFVSPGTRVGSAEDLKVRFNLLVDMFCFTVGLGVIGGGEGEVIVEELSELFDEGRSELWTTIRDDFVVEPKTEVYFVEEKGSYPFGSDGFLDRAENYPLRKAMVDHNQQRIEAGGSREVGDQVTGDLLEGVRCTGFDWGERGNSGVCIHRVLLAHGAAFNILAYEMCETRPPELRGNELVGLEVTWVTSSLMVMATGEDGTTERALWGDINTTFVGQDMIIKLPVGETRAEGCGDVLQGRLQVLEDEEIGLR